MFYILCKPLNGVRPSSSCSWILSVSDLRPTDLVFRSPSEDMAYGLTHLECELLLPVIRKRFPKYHVFLG